MNTFFYKTRKHYRAISLAEILVALVISSMVMITVISIYSRAESSAASIKRNFQSRQLPREVLQRIAEDLDKIIAVGTGTKITIKNKIDNSYPTAQLKILKTLEDDKKKTQILEEIIWQANYDFDSTQDGLVLYRSHKGMVLEDKLLDSDAEKEQWERELFIPVCSGLTYFSVQVPDGNDFLDTWTKNALPHGVTVTISFAEPYKTITGELEVPKKDKFIRTIAVDRTKKINFKIIKKEYGDQEEPNDLDLEKKQPDEEPGKKTEKDKIDIKTLAE